MKQDVQIQTVAHVGPLATFMLGIVMIMLVIHIASVFGSTFSTLNQPSFSAEPDWLFLSRQHHEQIHCSATGQHKLHSSVPMTTQSADTPRAESITLVPEFEGQHMYSVRTTAASIARGDAPHRSRKPILLWRSPFPRHPPESISAFW